MQWILQLLLLGCLLLLGRWVGLPAVTGAGFALAVAALLSPALPPRFAGAGVQRAALAGLWIGSLTIWLSVARGGIFWDPYYAALAGVMAAAVWITARRAGGGIWPRRWNAAVMAWLLAGALMWLGAGYLQNQRATFYAGLLATLAGLALCRWWFRPGAIGAQTLNTLILLLAGLAILDLSLRPQSRIAVQPETCRLYYSYTAAKGDPEAFGRWAEYYNAQFDHLGHDLFMADPKSILPFRLRPLSRSIMVSSPIAVNSLGFRGPEIAAAKDGAYRIVALGESSTFGMTIQREDQSWPEALEQIIRQRLKTRRPVQVINAGVPAYRLWDNLRRLPDEILPLQPDMLISYHGANGFYTIDRSLLPTLGPAPPVYRERPVKLAAEAEHRWRLWLFQYQARRRAVSSAPPPARPMDSPYAAAYLQLIQFARANGIRLALANFSMAVNQNSDPRVIDFYQGGGTRAAYGFIPANAAHSLIVRQLAAEHPEVCFVDTHPHLDGEPEKFIDPIHCSGDGYRQLAENIFAAIRPTLAQDLPADAANP